MTPVVPKPPSAKAKVTIPHSVKWHGALLARVIHLVAYSISSSLRLVIHDEPKANEQLLQGPVIFATWHNRLAVSLAVFQRVGRRKAVRRKIAALVSASRDGGLLARILEHFDVEPVRGSSSRRGARALMELIAWMRKGYDVAITPDGPRGPMYKVQEGIVALAQLTGYPIIPMAFNIKTKVCLNSWDQFRVPVPFSRCDIIFGQPIFVPREITDSERQRFRQEVEDRMLELNKD